MRKHGFTLVELMVAVVIMGVLASVAVPKLAEHVVKAKASEISPAAVSYTKLQSAYLYEHKSFGTWKKIGYEAPGGKKGKTDNFKYSKGDVTTSVKGNRVATTFAGDGKVAWQAENLVGLGRCQIGSKWQLKVVSTSDTEIEYRPIIVEKGSSSGCVSLAKDWGKFDLTASMDNAPKNHEGNSNSPTTPDPSSTPSVETSSGTVVAGGSDTPKSSSSATSSSSSESKVAETFYDAEEDFEDEDDGSCGVMYTSNGDRCPPSWCKLNGNVSRNHGGWSGKGHKWNECYAARQELISMASEAGQVNCKNKNVCKVTEEGKDLVINSFTYKGTTLSGLVISRSGEEVSNEEYEKGEFSSSSVESSSSSAEPVVYEGKGRKNAEAAFGCDVMCATNDNDGQCEKWRRASECPLPSKNNQECLSWE